MIQIQNLLENRAVFIKYRVIILEYKLNKNDKATSDHRLKLKAEQTAKAVKDDQRRSDVSSSIRRGAVGI
jgi:hypothetical protein